MYTIICCSFHVDFWWIKVEFDFCRLPYTFLTSDVAEATCACLLAQAEEAERLKMPPVVQERMVIEEFGRCLLQIIESANKTKGWSKVHTYFVGIMIWSKHLCKITRRKAVCPFNKLLFNCTDFCNFLWNNLLWFCEIKLLSMHMNAMMCIDCLFKQVAVLSLTYSIEFCRKHRHMIAWSWFQPCVIPAQVPAPVYPVPCLCVRVHVFITVSDLSLTVFSERGQMWDIEC